MVSRTKIENILTLALNCTNIALYLLVITAVIYKSINANFSQVVIAIYGGVMAIALIINEVKPVNLFMEYFRFLSLYSGRGLIFIFFGCIALDSGVLNIISATIFFVFGCLFIILQYVPSFPPPIAMSINWQNWKDYSAEGLDLTRPNDYHHTVEVTFYLNLLKYHYDYSQKIQLLIYMYACIYVIRVK
ncbi:COPI associated protein-domain-containing protein [Cunninghamella echinulata]|nr:COPI associated protein-domain-containing protein [Cunninghamella echinulata]